MGCTNSRPRGAVTPQAASGLLSVPPARIALKSTICSMSICAHAAKEPRSAPRP
jgi:hypothetical protein